MDIRDFTITVWTEDGHVGSRDVVDNVRDAARRFCDLRLDWKLSGIHGRMVLTDAEDGATILKARF
jgi:hypothetical protein